MNKTIYFDLDGTLVDLYADDEWLLDIQRENTRPFEEVTPLCDVIKFNIICNELVDVGFKIGFITWLPKNATEDYEKRVRAVKRNWIKTYYNFPIEEIHIVRYGTRKDYIAKNKKGFLFDDEKKNRENWKGFALDEKNILNVLEILKEIA